MAGSSRLGLFISPKHEKKNVLGSEQNLSEGLMQCYFMSLYLIYFLVLSLSHSFGSWMHITSHITSGFYHMVAPPSFSLALVDSWTQHEKTQQSLSPRGELWRPAPLVSVSRHHCLMVCGSTSCLLIWEPFFFFFCKVTCFLCLTHKSTLFIYFIYLFKINVTSLFFTWQGRTVQTETFTVCISNKKIISTCDCLLEQIWNFFSCLHATF